MFDIPIHKLIVHFPIALAIIAAVYDSWAVYAKKPELHDTGYGLTVWSSVFALAAVVTGLQLAGVSHVDRAAVTGHAAFGIAATTVLTTLAVLRYSARAREQFEYRILWLLLEIGAAALVFTTAVLGHQL